MNDAHSNPNANPPSPVAGILIDENALSIEELARACRVQPDWVVEHVEAGLLEAVGPAHDRQWRFTSASLVRARRMVHLEQGFDANPELAALAADLIEEVTQLRARLRMLGLGN